MTAVERLLNSARAELGYLEKASNSNLDDKVANAGWNNWTKYARDLDRLNIYNGPKNGYHWCDVFVDWNFITTFGVEVGLKMINQTKGDCGAGCTYSAQYYKNKGRLFYDNPQPGDQIFFGNRWNGDYYHTGIVEKVENGYVYTIEGNTDAGTGVVDNGGGVARKCYSLGYSEIGAYGRPDWSLITDETEDEIMDQAKWEQGMVAYRGKLQDNDAGNWSLESRDWAVDQGLVAGTGTLKDGTPNYAWQDFLTREQLVTILHRMEVKRAEGTLTV